MPNTTHTLRTPAAVALAALALASVSLAACGESSGGGSSQSSATVQKALAQIPKAKSAPSNTTQTSQPSTTNAPSTTATTPQPSPSNSGVHPGSTQPLHPARVSRFKQALEKFTACLHQNGVPVSKSTGKGLLGLQGVDRSSPKFRSAAMKCRGALSAALRGAG